LEPKCVPKNDCVFVKAACTLEKRLYPIEESEVRELDVSRANEEVAIIDKSGPNRSRHKASIFGLHGGGLDEKDQATRTFASTGAIGIRYAVGNLISWRQQLP